MLVCRRGPPRPARPHVHTTSSRTRVSHSVTVHHTLVLSSRTAAVWAPAAPSSAATRTGGRRGAASSRPAPFGLRHQREGCAGRLRVAPFARVARGRGGRRTPPYATMSGSSDSSTCGIKGARSLRRPDLERCGCRWRASAAPEGRAPRAAAVRPPERPPLAAGCWSSSLRRRQPAALCVQVRAALVCCWWRRQRLRPRAHAAHRP